MKYILTTAGVSLLAWIAIAPVAEAQTTTARYRCTQGDEFRTEYYDDYAVFAYGNQVFTLPEVEAESGSRYSNGNLTLRTDGNMASVDVGSDTVLENCQVYAPSSSDSTSGMVNPSADTNAPSSQVPRSAPNTAVDDDLGDDPGVDDVEVEGYQDSGEVNRSGDTNAPSSQVPRSAPNTAVDDDLGDDPGVDDVEVEGYQGSGTNDSGTEVNRPTYNRSGTESSTSQSTGNVTRPTYNRPVTGQTTGQQPTGDYNRPTTTQAPASQPSSGQTSEPVRGLW